MLMNYYAILYFVSGLLISYDLWERCHLVLSIEALLLFAVPGVVEGMKCFGWDIYFKRVTFITLCKTILNPLWFLPNTILKCLENIVYLNYDTKFAVEE